MKSRSLVINTFDNPILPVITEVITTVMHQNAAEILRSIPLSNDKMTNDVETQLINI